MVSRLTCCCAAGGRRHVVHGEGEVHSPQPRGAQRAGRREEPGQGGRVRHDQVCRRPGLQLSQRWVACGGTTTHHSLFRCPPCQTLHTLTVIL